MSTRRRLAAISVLVLALPLLSGRWAPRAEELSGRQSEQAPLPLLQLDQPAPPARNPAPSRPQQPPTIGSFPRSFVIPGTETSVTISGSMQTNFGAGYSR